MVKSDESDESTGPDSGADEHTIKLPLLKTSAVCAEVTSCWMNKTGDVVDPKMVGETTSDKIVYEAKTLGNLAESSPKEPESSEHPTNN